MISYLGSLVQFSPAMGKVGRCRQISLSVDSTHCVLATLGLPRSRVSVLSPSTLLRLPAALYGAGPALSAVPVFGSSTKARIRLRLRIVSSQPCRLRQPEACAPSPRLRRTFSLPGEQLRQAEVCAASPRARRLFPPLRVAQAARGLVHSPPVRRAFSLRGPSARRRSGLRKSLDRNRGLLQCGRGWVLWG